LSRLILLSEKMSMEMSATKELEDLRERGKEKEGRREKQE